MKESQKKKKKPENTEKEQRGGNMAKAQTPINDCVLSGK